MQWDTLATWVAAFGSLMAGVGAFYAAHVVSREARVARKMRLQMTRDAHKPKLEAACKLNESEQIEFKIENIGPKVMFIDYIALSVRQNGCEQIKPIETGELRDGVPPKFNLSESEPPAEFQPGVVALESGDTCSRYVYLPSGKETFDNLKELIRNDADAATVQFVIFVSTNVHADPKKFPVKAEKSVIAAIVNVAMERE